MTPWKPIEEYKSEAFDPHVVYVRAEGVEPELASEGWDEEYWDGYSVAWHVGNGLTALGYTPEEWCEIDELEDEEGIL